MKVCQRLSSWVQQLQRDKITMPEPVWLPQDYLVSSFQNSKGIQDTSIITEEQAAKTWWWKLTGKASYLLPLWILVKKTSIESVLLCQLIFLIFVLTSMNGWFFILKMLFMHHFIQLMIHGVWRRGICQINNWLRPMEWDKYCWDWGVSHGQVQHTN